MTIDTSTMISITEANQNFSKVARLVDERGTAVILKNNVPRYLVIDLAKQRRTRSHLTKTYQPFQRDYWHRIKRRMRCLLNEKTE